MTSENEISEQIRDLLSCSLSHSYQVRKGASILYKIVVNAKGQAEPSDVEHPVRGQLAFETDILVEQKSPSIPLVVLELKCGGFSTHDVITYSSKAARHKDIYPYLRYGLVVVDSRPLTKKFMTHNQGFDFALALPDVSSHKDELIGVVRRQLESAEQLISIMQPKRAKFWRYEEIVHVKNMEAPDVSVVKE